MNLPYTLAPAGPSRTLAAPQTISNGTVLDISRETPLRATGDNAAYLRECPSCHTAQVLHADMGGGCAHCDLRSRPQTLALDSARVGQLLGLLAVINPGVDDVDAAAALLAGLQVRARVALNMRLSIEEVDHVEPIIYITNGTCEEAGFVHPAVLIALGLDVSPALGYGTDPYPLTPAEGSYLEESIETPAYEILAGYSALYYGAKWFAPTIEIVYSSPTATAHPEAPSEASARAAALKLQQFLTTRVGDLGGFVRVSAGEHDDRYVVTTMLPVGAVRERWPDPSTYHAWLKHLPDARPTV